MSTAQLPKVLGVCKSGTLPLGHNILLFIPHFLRSGVFRLRTTDAVEDSKVRMMTWITELP